MFPEPVTNTICCREQTGDQKLPLFQKKVIYWWESLMQCWRWSFSSLKKSYKPEGSLASSNSIIPGRLSPAHSLGLCFYSGCPLTFSPALPSGNTHAYKHVLRVQIPPTHMLRVQECVSLTSVLLGPRTKPEHRRYSISTCYMCHYNLYLM